MMLSLAITVVFINGINAQQQASLNWSKFDFVAGDEIIFEDNLEGERNGEFPSKWDLVNGTVENAVLDGENVIMFIKTNTNSTGGIAPMMANGHEDYLPDEFTVEFDAYFDNHNRTYRVLFYDGKNQGTLNRNTNPGSNHKVDRIRVTQNSVVYGDTRGNYPGFGESSSDDASRSKPGWRRVSISFNKRALKVYLDDARVLNIPNMSFNPLGLTFAYHNPTGGHLGYIRNIRLAKGAVPLYDKILTDGKIVTTGIRFDVNNATIRPESMGVINEIVQLMQQHPELNFSVEGHTDSDGTAELNQRLSEERARAVMEKMVEMGISPNRLISEGHGQSQPIAPNTTPEGKAQNRRVEFVNRTEAELFDSGASIKPALVQPTENIPTDDAPEDLKSEIMPKPANEEKTYQEKPGIGITYKQFVQKVRALKIPGFSGSPRTDQYPDGSAYEARFKRGEEGTSILLMANKEPDWFGEPYKLDGKNAQYLDHGGMSTITIYLPDIQAVLFIGSTTILDKAGLEQIALQTGLMQISPGSAP